MKRQSNSIVQLFYSYCHRDAKHRKSMETSLAALKRDGLLQQWSDQQILPGQGISSEIRAKMEQADIIVFLFSPDFIDSEECMKEWTFAQTLANRSKPLFRIPVIVRDCAWKDVLKGDDVKALPVDGKSVTSYPDVDLAWHQVYEGIKAIVDQLRRTFRPKLDFIKEIERTDFISQDHLRLQDLFVFLSLTTIDPKELELPYSDKTISNLEELLSTRRAVVFGQEKTGKTALARYIYLSLVEKGKPALLLDLASINRAPSERMLRDAYQDQFHGDYSLWINQSCKTLILDNLSSTSQSLDLVDFAKDRFDNIFITVGSDAFYAFFLDETRLADFRQLGIEQLTRQQQEQLIRRRLSLSETGHLPSDGLVDRVERHVNAIIISDKVVPRFPFYVLSILQTYEAYMPSNMSITSYGHCYYVLIFANLVRAGISRTDDAINACFNFAERLAFDIYQHRQHSVDEQYDFGVFIAEYNNSFFIRQSIINRLKNPTHGIINNDGTFKTDYMYYYFLGRFLAHNREIGDPIIHNMCKDSHREANYLTLLFTIHHTTDSSIIDDILLHTMLSLESVEPAVLNREETKRFNSIVVALPEDILSQDSVEQARAKERTAQDALDIRSAGIEDGLEDMPEHSPVNAVYSILKNNKIIGQILRNKYGNLERSRIKETIEVVVDSGLRLVNYTLGSEEEISEVALFIKAQHPDWDTLRIKRGLELFSFLWTMVNIEQVVNAISVPEIGEAVDAVVSEKATPAYDLVGYFNLLDNTNELTEIERGKLAALLKQHDDMFIKRVLSMRTQHYMNTHRSKAMTEQAVCSLLDIQYRPRIVRAP